MTWSPTGSPERRDAIARASRALVRLSCETDLTLEVRRHHHIVGDVTAYTDLEAWEAVATLEDLVDRRGLNDPHQPSPGVRVRLAPGHFMSSAVHAICEDCGWIGPVRDQRQRTGPALLEGDRREHDCS